MNGTITRLMEFADYYANCPFKEGSGVAKEYKETSRQALKDELTRLFEPTQKGWCTGCTPDNCQGCGGASEGYNGITKG